VPGVPYRQLNKPPGKIFGGAKHSDHIPGHQGPCGTASTLGLLLAFGFYQRLHLRLDPPEPEIYTVEEKELVVATVRSSQGSAYQAYETVFLRARLQFRHALRKACHNLLYPPLLPPYRTSYPPSIRPSL
jgi:hypothetical protein